jgi:stage II sporulation protein AA (anti-sigma F factor antagonist)
MEFTCAARQSGRRLIVTVAGDLDLAVYPRLQAEADIWSGKGLDVVLDCSDVTFMDSMGLRVLVQLRRNLMDAGRTLVLANPSARVRRVLELAGVQGLFALAPGAEFVEAAEAVEGDEAVGGQPT